MGLASDVNSVPARLIVEVEGERAEMMGREGNLVLVDGKRSNMGIAVRTGEARRWRMINAANGRYFDLTFAGGRMVRAGGDGGLIERPEDGPILLVPGERADVIVRVERADVIVWVERPGETGTLRARPHERAMIGEVEAR